MSEDKEHPDPAQAPAGDAPAGDAPVAEPVPVEPEPAAAASPVDAESPPAAAAAEPPRRRGGALAAIALLLALIACAGVGYLWWLDRQRPEVTIPDMPEIPDVAAEVTKQVRPLRSTVAELRGEFEQGLGELRADGARLAAGRDGIDRALAKIEDDARRGFAGLERRLTNLETGLAALADVRSSTTAELALVETEFLLRAANERLQLFNDPRGALTALTLAQSRLDAVDDPMYTSVRQTLAAHLQALRQIELPDRVALSGRLLGLARNSVEWPLDARRSLQAGGNNLLTPNKSDQGWWPRFKEVLSSVVVVHREKQAEAVLLTLEEERLLRENVRLQLQVAQLAAVRGEQPLFEAAIDAVSDWLGAYYDGESSLVADALSQLGELRAIDLNPTLPDINAALRQLRNVRAAESLADGAEARPVKAFAALLVGVLLALLTIWGLPFLKGYVLVRAGGWAVEMNVLVFLVMLLLIYALLRLAIWAWNLPGNVVRRFFQRRANAQLEVGMLALSEGNWRKAEKALSKSAKNSDRPAMSYLGAAQAAHHRGGESRAEDYLDQAEQDGRAKDSATITRAQLQLASNQPEAALESLNSVRRGNESRPRVLQLLARCYERLDRWQDLAELAPALTKSEIITAEQGQDITRRATLHRLDSAADVGELKSQWRQLDRFSRRDYQFLAALASNAVKLGAGEEAEKDLLAALKKNWSEPLIRLYSELPNPGATLAQAEKWLKSHPDSAALHLLTARLCARSEIWGKAREHYETSARLHPDPIAYAELAELKAREGDTDGALSDYRRALGTSAAAPLKAAPKIEHS